MIDATAREAWTELESKLRPFVTRRVRPATDIDDVLQDVLLRLHRGLPGLHDDQRFGPWVYQVARSAITDHRRRSMRHAFEPISEDESEAEEPDAEDRSVERAMAAYVGRLVAMLPSPYREALTLTELEGLSQRDAAEMLGVSLTCMKSRVQRGRERLRKAFEACCVVALDVRGGVLSCEPRATGPLPGCHCGDGRSQS